jgi:hypothetical protein
MSDNFIFHAFAIGVSGRITAPFDEVIPVQASSALPGAGGFGTSRIENFRFRNILSFDAATAVVAGSDSPAQTGGQDSAKSPDMRSHDAVATTIVEGLDILGVVKADRIVARIASSHPFDKTKPSSIVPIGTSFENLRIAGHKAEIDLAIDTFSKLATAQSVRDAFRNNTDGFRDEFKQMTLIGREGDIPAAVKKYFSPRDYDTAENIPQSNGVIIGSLVRQIKGLGPELMVCGHIVVVPSFGIIRLGELKITNSARRILMLQVHLGSTPEGNIGTCGAEGNGDGF